MPANLTPDYKKADEWFRSATTDEERLAALEEMYRTIPKHKGTEGLQADIKRRISKFKDLIESGGRPGGVKHADVFHVPHMGAGQVALVGMPNSGKSSIVAAVSNARVHVADYPFATDKPVPGMMRCEDVQIQIVDTPPITAEFAPVGLVNTMRGADLIAIVIDLSDDVLGQMETCLKYLDEHHLIRKGTEPPDDPIHHLAKDCFVLCTKADLAPDGTLVTLKDLCPRPLEFVETSVKTAAGLDVMARQVFTMLKVIRIYAKPPGKPADMKEPFSLPMGSTVLDLAQVIHRELAEKVKNARVWGTDVYAGQHVQLHHELHDKDVVELHFA
jgi:ribosome-interacting GTPase 1